MAKFTGKKRNEYGIQTFKFEFNSTEIFNLRWIIKRDIAYQKSIGMNITVEIMERIMAELDKTLPNGSKEDVINA